MPNSIRRIDHLERIIALNMLKTDIKFFPDFNGGGETVRFLIEVDGKSVVFFKKIKKIPYTEIQIKKFIEKLKKDFNKKLSKCIDWKTVRISNWEEQQ